MVIDPTVERCDSMTILWPDQECIDVHCVKPRGHEEEAEHDGAFVHTDGDGTWWNDRNEVEFR